MSLKIVIVVCIYILQATSTVIQPARSQYEQDLLELKELIDVALQQYQHDDDDDDQPPPTLLLPISSASTTIPKTRKIRRRFSAALTTTPSNNSRSRPVYRRAKKAPIMQSVNRTAREQQPNNNVSISLSRPEGGGGWFRWLQDVSKSSQASANLSIYEAPDYAHNVRQNFHDVQQIAIPADPYDGYYSFESDGTPAVEKMLSLQQSGQYISCEGGFFESLVPTVETTRFYGLPTVNDKYCRTNCNLLSGSWRPTTSSWLVDPAVAGCNFPVVEQFPLNVLMFQNDTPWQANPDHFSDTGSRTFYMAMIDDVKRLHFDELSAYDVSQVLAGFDSPCSDFDARTTNATLLLRGPPAAAILYGSLRESAGQMQTPIYDSCSADIKAGASDPSVVVVDTSFWFRKWLIANTVPYTVIGVETMCPESVVHPITDDHVAQWNSSVIMEVAGAWVYGVDPACNKLATCEACLAHVDDQDRQCTWCVLPSSSRQSSFWEAVGFDSPQDSQSACGMSQVACLRQGGTFSAIQC